MDTTKLDKIDAEIAKAEQAKKDAAKQVRALRKARVAVLEELVASNS